MNLAGVAVGRDNPCRFIAEISNAHNGDKDRALRLIEVAKTAGADIVKFQCYTPDELVALRGDGPAPVPWGTQGWSMRDLYAKAQTPHDWLPALVEKCSAIGIPWFASVFGPQSFALLESLNCPAYKIARLDNAATPLIMSTAATGKTLVVSRSADQKPFALPGRDRPIWLHCPPGYPQADADWKLPLFDEICGFTGVSAHTKSPKLVSTAVARGAKLFEFHFQLRQEPSELEAEFSLDQHQFAAAVLSARMTEALL